MGTVVTTGSISTGSMIACCLHHVVDVLPILGLSAIAFFLSQYQSLFLALGVVANLIGITFMFFTIQKHHLFIQGGLLSKLMRWDMKRLMFMTIGFGAIGLTILFIQSWN